MTTLFVVGKVDVLSPRQWEFMGVFDDEELAMEACKDERYFVGPVELNETIPETQTEWPMAYYPKAAPSRG
jgi:hypothetical protein